MPEEPRPRNAWIKTICSALAGVLSGALVMYLTPLVDRVVKPAKPLANFAVEHDGLTVTFHNRSIGGRDGWWDFGDGSPLERVQPQAEIVKHTYEKPGDYIAKLTLENLLGDNDERSVTVQLEPAQALTPEIESFVAEAVSQGSVAPATFRLVCKAKNAELFVWDTGDNRPLEIATEASGTGADKTIVFYNPGTYLVKVAALNGAHADQRILNIVVGEAPAGTVAVSVQATDQATRIQKLHIPFTFQDVFPVAEAGDVYHFTHQVPAKSGCVITDIHLGSADGPGLQGQTAILIDPGSLQTPAAENLRLQLAPDRRSATLTGDLLRKPKDQTGETLPSRLNIPVVLDEEKHTHASRNAVSVTSTIQLPGSTVMGLPPLPADWTNAQRQFVVELLDGDKSVWKSSALPIDTAVAIRGQNYHLTAHLDGVRLQIALAPAKP